MKKKNSYDVFISYRRDGGEHTAKIICDKLTNMGYRVFFDVESLRSGEFNKELYRVIEQCKDVIVILSPNSLERCKNEGDWVRQEIACALKNQKNIVPVMLRGFSFPDVLPEDIDLIRWKNGIEASTEFFDAFLQKLTTFLETKPSMRHRIVQNFAFRQVVPLAAAFIVVAGAAAGGIVMYQNRNQTFPRTVSDKNVVADSISYVVTNLSYANGALSSYETALKTCEGYLSGKTDTTLDEAVSRIDYSSDQVQSYQDQLYRLEEQLSAELNHTPLPKDDFSALYTYLYTTLDGLEKDLSFLESYLQQDGAIASTQLKYVETLLDMVPLNGDILFYNTNLMFLEVDGSALEKLKTEMLPQLTSIYRGQSWSLDEKELEGLTNRAFNAYEEKVSEIAAYVGNEQQATDHMKSDLESQKKELAEVYGPQEEDGTDRLWAKFALFNSVHMADMAKQCLDAYEEKDGSDEAAVIISAARAFLENETKTGYDGGCLVGGFENSDVPHRQLKIGDIVVSVNGEPVKNADQLIAVRGREGESYRAEVLRFQGDEFTVTEKVVESGQTRVLFFSLTLPDSDKGD